MISSEFIRKRPYLYHLTSKDNYLKIIEKGRILSTNRLIDMSDNKNYEAIKRTKRRNHEQILINGETFQIRDQKPISEVLLSKCLTDNWTVADYLEHLNNRVFTWPTINRLEKHFNTYASENPIILRLQTDKILETNPHVKFCRLNSGATRANSYLGGKPPERGSRTFLSAENYELSISSVAEVTFECECVLAGDIFIGDKPNGIFKKIV